VHSFKRKASSPDKSEKQNNTSNTALESVEDESNQFAQSRAEEGAVDGGSQTPLLDLAAGQDQEDTAPGQDPDREALLERLERLAEYIAECEAYVRESEGDSFLTSCAESNLQSALATKEKLLEALNTDGRMEAGVANADDIVSLSNDRDDPTWDIMNGGHDAVNIEKGKAKPDEWRNGFQIEEGNVSLNREGYESEIDTLDEYREMLVSDFDFSGTIEAFLEQPNAEQSFVDAMIERYCGEESESDPAFVAALSSEIWAYATTGADSTGVTDIAQMQGMLRALDSEIVKSSDSNTPMSEDEFTLPGTDYALPEGDGLHGRATILTTRHLLGGLEPAEAEAEAEVETEKEPPEIEKDPPETAPPSKPPKRGPPGPPRRRKDKGKRPRNKKKKSKNKCLNKGARKQKKGKRKMKQKQKRQYGKKPGR
jgi:hypothetical protein